MLKHRYSLVLCTALVAHAELPQWPSEGQAQVCAPSAQQLYQVLEARAPERMEVYYFDTPALKARAEGVYLRLRFEADETQVTLKWRQQDLTQVPAGARCELDVTRDRALPSCSWDSDVDRGQAQAVLKGEAPVHQLLSAHQWDVYKELLQRVKPESLVAFGPVAMERRKISGPDDLKWRLETWPITAEKVVLEVSYRDRAEVPPESVRQKMNDYFRQKQLTRCPVETSKTDLVLDSGRHPGTP